MNQKSMSVVRWLACVVGLAFTVMAAAPHTLAAPAAIITVTNNLDEITNGNGCSLREALTNANNNAATYGDCTAGSGADVIQFNIGGGGTQTISPSSELPTITDPVTIDGTSQPSCAVPCIVLDGGSAPLSNQGGLTITAGSSVIKGLVIHSFSAPGIWLETNGGNEISGNYIGTDVTGKIAKGNAGDGILIDNSPNNLIGGTSAAARNVIADSGGYAGVNILGSGSTGNRVQGNYIGTNATGKVAMGNVAGILLAEGAHNNTIGGELKGQGNLIRFNIQGIAIAYDTTSATETGNMILRNRIFSNTGLGIDLGWNSGVTANDALDADTGPNNLQNFPILKRAESATQTVKGRLLSTPNTTFTIEFFKNGKCDSSGNGEGQRFIGSKTVTTDATGLAKFRLTTKTFKPAKPITATATDADGNTSEFSKCKNAK